MYGSAFSAAARRLWGGHAGRAGHDLGMGLLTCYLFLAGYFY